MSQGQRQHLSELGKQRWAALPLEEREKRSRQLVRRRRLLRNLMIPEQREEQRKRRRELARRRFETLPPERQEEIRDHARHQQLERQAAMTAQQKRLAFVRSQASWSVNYPDTFWESKQRWAAMRREEIEEVVAIAGSSA